MIEPGRVLMLGFAGTEVTDELAGRLRRIDPAGVILFRRNLESPEQCAGLLAAVGRALPGPRLYAIDQEGGRVSRLEPWLGPTPTATALADSGEDALEAFARATARALSVLGFNVDFAPVIDLCAPGVPNGIGDRSYGTDPERVTRLARRFLEGLAAHGVAGCLKHFPGLGDTSVDSHDELPVVTRSREQLRANDLLPYRRLGSSAPAVMVGHAHYPAWDSDSTRPATGSRRIVAELLRRELGYEGLIVSDDLEMGAVRERDTDGAFAVEALTAGCDLLLYCAELERADAAAAQLRSRASSDSRFAERLAEAAARVARFSERWPAPAPRIADWAAARQAMRDTLSALG